MIDVVVDLEDNGVAVDTEYLYKLKEKYHKKLDDSINKCYAEMDSYKDKIDKYKSTHINHKLEDPINIGSDAQLQILFYDILGAKSIPDKKARSVDADVMKEFAKKYPIAKYILDYRSAVKLTSTYIDNMFDFIKKDGRVHTHFNSNGARTGRMSSSNPLNLQNIPSRNHDLRKMFVGQVTYRDIDSDNNKYTLDRSEEVQLQDESWVWAEKLKSGDTLLSGEIVKTVTIEDFNVLVEV